MDEAIERKRQDIGEHQPRKAGLYPILQDTALVLPTLPSELQQLFMIQNRDLKPHFWGVAFAIWVLQPYFPMNTSRVYKALNMERKYFWRVIDILAKRKVVFLKYSRKSPWFSASFFTPASQAQSRVISLPVTPASSDRSNQKNYSGLPDTEYDPTPASNDRSRAYSGLPSPVVVVDFKTNNNNPTTANVTAAISGQAFDAMTKIVAGFRPGHLLPHLQCAQVFCPQNPSERLRGSIFYLVDCLQRGQKLRSPLAMLMKYIENGLVLDDIPNLSKKAPSNVKPKSDYVPPPPVDWKLKTGPEIIRIAQTLAFTHKNFSQLQKNLLEFFYDNPNFPEVEKEIEVMAREGRFNFKKEVT
ncbi:MAG: hypothetical protein ACREL1_00320 [bacterium]